jgi:hypothetical protein
VETSTDWKDYKNEKRLGDFLIGGDTVAALTKRKWLTKSALDTYEWTDVGVEKLYTNRKIHPMHYTNVTNTRIRDLIHKMRVKHDNLIKVQFDGMGAKTATDQTRDESVKIAAYSTMRAEYEQKFRDFLQTHVVDYARKSDDRVKTRVNEYETLGDFLKFLDDPSDTHLAVNAAVLQHLDPVLCGFSNTIDGVAATSRTTETMNGDVAHLANLIWHTAHAVAVEDTGNYILWVKYTSSDNSSETQVVIMTQGKAKFKKNLVNGELTLDRGELTVKYNTGEQKKAKKQVPQLQQMCSSTWTATLSDASYVIAFGPYPYTADNRWYCEKSGVFTGEELDPQRTDNASHLFKSQSAYVAITSDYCLEKLSGVAHKFLWDKNSSKRMLPDVLYLSSGYNFTQTLHTLNVRVLLTPTSYVFPDAVPIDHDDIVFTKSGASLAIPSTDTHVRVWKNAKVQHDVQLPIIGMMGHKRKRDTEEPEMKWSVGVRGSPFLTAMEVTLNVIHNGIPLSNLEFGGFHYGVLNADTGLQETSTALLPERSLHDVIRAQKAEHIKRLGDVVMPNEESPFYMPARVNVRGCDVYGMTTTCCIANFFTKTPALHAAESVIGTFLRKHTPPLTAAAIDFMYANKRMCPSPTEREKLLAAHAYALGTAQATDKWHDEKVLSRLESRLRILISAWVLSAEAINSASTTPIEFYENLACV